MRLSNFIIESLPIAGDFFFNMKTLFLSAVLLLSTGLAFSQELYVFSEPASNMPARTLSTKFSVMAEKMHHSQNRYQKRLTPELMFGINKNLMIHGASTFSDIYSKGVRWESAFIYGKYRFLSVDEVHRHFRMAAFAEGSYSRNEPAFEEINLTGDRSGIAAGLIATQLVNKFAASATAGLLRATENRATFPQTALNYSLSAGLLLLPREYRNYNQLNLNLYGELLGQKSLDGSASYLDFAPSIQLIFNSNSKLNIGYRFMIAGDMQRSMKNYGLLSFEHTFFKLWK